MHRALSVGFGSSESGFGTSVNSTMLASASEKSPSGSWMSSYVPSISDIVSICNAVVGFSEVLEYSFPSLKVGFQENLSQENNHFTFYLLGSHLWSKSKHNKSHKTTWLHSHSN